MGPLRFAAFKWAFDHFFPFSHCETSLHNGRQKNSSAVPLRTVGLHESPLHSDSFERLSLPNKRPQTNPPTTPPSRPQNLKLQTATCPSMVPRAAWRLTCVRSLEREAWGPREAPVFHCCINQLIRTTGRGSFLLNGNKSQTATRLHWTKGSGFPQPALLCDWLVSCPSTKSQYGDLCFIFVSGILCSCQVPFHFLFRKQINLCVFPNKL